jgi:hypothetical protein
MLLSFLVLLNFLLSHSGGPAALDIHDVPYSIVPAAAVISDVISALAVVGRFTTSASIPAVAGVPAIMTVPLLLLFLMLLLFLLLLPVTVLLSSLLFLASL